MRTGSARARTCAIPPSPTHPHPSRHTALLPVPQVGENPALAEELEAGVPCVESVLLPKLTELLVAHYGATPKAA